VVLRAPSLFSRHVSWSAVVLLRNSSIS
jgi:hypothetical protein